MSELNIHDIPVTDLKRGLSEIKKAIKKTTGLGPVWKLNKSQVINRIHKLNYRYRASDDTLRTDSFIRKKPTVYLL